MPLNFFAAVGPSQLVFGNGIVFGTSLEHLLTLLALYDISTPVLPKASQLLTYIAVHQGKGNTHIFGGLLDTGLS